MQVDYFGFEYDEAIAPAFVILPVPPHPLDESGSGKFAYHRPTRKLFDIDALSAAMSEDGYTPPSGEVGPAPGWLREHTDYKVPYEFTLVPILDKWSSRYMQFTVTGGPATERVWFGTQFHVDGVKLGEPAYPPNSRFGFWIEVGMTATQVANTYRFVDQADQTAFTDDGYDLYYRVDSGRSGTTIDMLAMTKGSELTPRRISAAMIPSPVFTGVNVEFAPAPRPPVRFVPDPISALQDDGYSCTLTVMGKVLPDRGNPSYEYQVHKLALNGTVALSLNSQREYAFTVPEGSTADEVAAAAAAYWNGMALTASGVATGFTIFAVADQNTVKFTAEDADGNPAKFMYPVMIEGY